jgi:hypothetical protein
MMTATNFMQRRRSPINMISSMNNESLRIASSKTPKLLSSEHHFMDQASKPQMKKKPT